MSICVTPIFVGNVNHIQQSVRESVIENTLICDDLDDAISFVLHNPKHSLFAGVSLTAELCKPILECTIENSEMEIALRYLQNCILKNNAIVRAHNRMDPCTEAQKNASKELLCVKEDGQAYRLILERHFVFNKD